MANRTQAKPEEIGRISAEELQRRRANARRTAWVLGGIVAVIFTTFFLTGVIGR